MPISIRALRSSAPFWSVRYHEEKRETLAMRQDTLEPPRRSLDRGAMLTAVVEGGYGPMRFDDSIYRILGESLVDLTSSRELLPDASTYGERQTSSARLPGALLGALRFTL